MWMLTITMDWSILVITILMWILVVTLFLMFNQAESFADFPRSWEALANSICYAVCQLASELECLAITCLVIMVIMVIHFK